MVFSRVRGRGFGIFVVLVAACAPIRRPAESALKASTPEGAALDQKLNEQFARFAAAKELLLQTVAVDKVEVTREAWEAVLKGPEFTKADLEALSDRQRRDAAASRKNSEGRSELDLKKLSPSDVSSFCRDLPKGGMLHVHPFGTLDRETIHDLLANKVNPLIDFGKLLTLLDSPGGTGELTPPELDGLKDLAATYQSPVAFGNLGEEERLWVENLFFLPKNSHSFDRFTAVFTSASTLLFANPPFNPESTVDEAFFQRAAAHHVRYVEVTRNVVARPAWLQSLAGAAQKVKDKHGLTVRYLASFARNKDAAFTRTKTEQLLKLSESPILVGVNLLADETNYPALEFGQTLYGPLLGAIEAKTSHLHRSIHAGELGDPRNVRDSLVMGAERIGHGVKLKDDLVALEYARKLKTPIETNLVSNLRLKAVASLSEHPFLHFLRLGLPVSLSTDDEGIFETTIDDECVTAVSGTDVTYDELKTMSLNGIRTSFADQATKDGLMAEVEADYKAFETKWERLRKAH